jgi:hypothetical protein
MLNVLYINCVLLYPSSSSKCCILFEVLHQGVCVVETTEIAKELREVGAVTHRGRLSGRRVANSVAAIYCFLPRASVRRAGKSLLAIAPQVPGTR